MPVIQQNNSQQILFFVFPRFHTPVLKEHWELLGENGSSDCVVSVVVTGAEVADTDGCPGVCNGLQQTDFRPPQLLVSAFKESQF